VKTASIDRDRLASFSEREQQRFVSEHPRSRSLFEEGHRSLLGGVPMNWMSRWAGRFPVFVAEAEGARFTDVDGHEYVDLCLGDTGAMTGHSPPAAVAAVAAAIARGITLMLPTEDALAVGDAMARRFGIPKWQFTLSATDANRFVIRLARHITNRSKVLVFNGCYHGSADETIIGLDGWKVVPRRGSVGPPVDPALTTKVVEFNDLEGLERALGDEDVACVLAEPVMTNIGIIFPDPGYHAALRSLTRDSGTLLVIDETHTICTGPGGYTAEYGLEPDMLTIGKPIGSGVPSGAYGVTDSVAERIGASVSVQDADVGGIGGTLAGNALALAAIRATLTEVLTEDAYARMIPLAERLEAGVQDTIDRYAAPWHVKRLGCRVEYRFQADPPRNGSEAAASEDPLLDEYLHLYCLNRGILLTPFHNMALMSPATTEAAVDRHTEVFAECVEELIG